MLKTTLPLLVLLVGGFWLGPRLILKATDFLLGYPVDWIRVQERGDSRL